jgi:hypothetical protein
LFIAQPLIQHSLRRRDFVAHHFYGAAQGFGESLKNAFRHMVIIGTVQKIYMQGYAAVNGNRPEKLLHKLKIKIV